MNIYFMSWSPHQLSTILDDAPPPTPQVHGMQCKYLRSIKKKAGCCVVSPKQETGMGRQNPKPNTTN